MLLHSIAFINRLDRDLSRVSALSNALLRLRSLNAGDKVELSASCQIANESENEGLLGKAGEHHRMR